MLGWGSVFWVIVFGLRLAGAALTPSEILLDRLQGPRVGAHQGGIFSARPNTLRQFKVASSQGMDIIEMDLRLTKDGVPVVFHDEKLDLLSHCKGNVRDFTLAEVKDCNLKFNDESIPSFEEVLSWNAGQKVLSVEFKDDDVIEPAIDLAYKYDSESSLYFQTQNNRGKYHRARAHSESIPLLYAIHHPEDLDWALKLDDPALVVLEVIPETRTKEIISQIKYSGKKVTEDVWNRVWHKELFGAACDKSLRDGIDIAISNRVGLCVRQK